MREVIRWSHRKSSPAVAARKRVALGGVVKSLNPRGTRDAPYRYRAARKQKVAAVALVLTRERPRTIGDLAREYLSAGAVVPYHLALGDTATGRQVPGVPDFGARASIR